VIAAQADGLASLTGLLVPDRRYEDASHLTARLRCSIGHVSLLESSAVLFVRASQPGQVPNQLCLRGLPHGAIPVRSGARREPEPRPRLLSGCG
jgi:hypothetical protein